MPEIRGELRLPDGTPGFRGARVTVRVEDVTYQDAAAKALAEWIREDVEWREGAIEFRLEAPEWDPRSDVALSARIETTSGDRRTFWNPAAQPVQPGAYVTVKMAPARGK